MPTSKTNRIALYVSAAIIIILILFAILRDNSEAITLKDAKQILDDNVVTKVVVTKEYVYLKTSQHFYKIASSQVTPVMFANYKVEVGSDSHILLYILFGVLLLGLGSLGFRYWQKNPNTLMGNSSSKGLNSSSPSELSANIEPTKSDVSFSDIGGISDVKIELEEIIDFMKNPKRYKSFGARMPRGVLLVGPPGVGKTMIAKAVAHEAGVPFYYQSGASFVQIYVGLSLIHI